MSQLVLCLVHSRSSFLVFQFTVSEFLFYLSLAGWKFILIAYKIFTVYFKDFLMKTMPCSPFWFFHFVFALMLLELSCEKEIQRLVWLPMLPKSLNCNLRSATHPGVTKEAVYLTIQDGMTYRIPRECDTVYIGKTHQNQPRKAKPCYFTCLYSDLWHFHACSQVWPLSSLEQGEFYWSRPSLLHNLGEEVGPIMAKP